MEDDEACFGWAARAGLAALGLVLAAAGLLAGFFAVALIAATLSETLAQPWRAYALVIAMLAFPALLIAAGLRCVTSRRWGQLRPAAVLVAVAAADSLLVVLLVRLEASRCVTNPPVVRGAIEATGCLDPSWSPPS